MKRAYKTEIEPNNVQRTLLLKHAGAARFTWNWGLARRIQEYKETGKSSNAIEQHRQLNQLKKADFPWMYAVSKAAPQEALRNLDKACDNFFRRVKKGGKPGFPKFKSKKSGKNSFRLTGSIRVTATHVKLPRIGWLKLKERSYIPVDGLHILSAAVSETAGRWFVSLQGEQELIVSKAMGEPIGVDLGIKSMAVCSNGQRFENPKALRKAQKKLRRVQRELSRRKKSGSNRDKTRRKLAQVHYRIANIRKDALHKATSAITAKTKPDSERPSVIVLEDLNVAGMVKNHHLAQAIVDVGFGEFRRQTEYKTLWVGEQLMLAPRFFASSKLCSVCGLLNSELTLADRFWTCTGCGTFHDRDENAATNLKSLAYREFPGNVNACGENVRPEFQAVLIEARTKHKAP